MIEYGLATTAEKFLLLICFTPWYLPHHFCKLGRMARNGGAQRPTLQFISLSLLLVLLKDEVAAASSSLALPGCQDKCGNVSIPYPFGIGSNCSKDSSFEVSCDSTAAAGYTPTISIGFPKASEVIEILPENKVKIITNRLWLFNASENESQYFLNLIDTPFYLSQDRNVFTTVGCDILGYMISGGIRVGGCLSTCIFMSGTVEVNKRVRIAPTGCNGGYGCCQTSILPLLQYLQLGSSRVTALTDTAYAFIADKEWLGNDFNVTAYKENPTAKRPVVLDWVIGNGTCETANPSSNCGPNSYCRNVTSGDGYACFCNRGYEGNPYLRQGCHDIDECADTKTNGCGWTCVNGPGNYSCSCPPGYHGDGKKIGVGCMKEKEVKRYIPWVIGIGSSFTILLLLLGSFWLYQLHKKIKSRKMKENFFKQNGGLLLQHQISSEESNVEKTKIFLAEELEKATDHYNINRILGQGGQGTVYKGMLVDGKIVAVKKSKKLDEEVDKDQVEQFINEVVILSQINHRNVVKLLGCCLETEVPLLVYEFISKGTLFQYIHNQSEDFIFTWENRLRIAIEVAGALSYLHSSAATPIYHRDIKSTNILLDDKYRAKVSDFGTSKSIAIDKTHLTTRVQGTFGYLDPEYFQTNQFTDKSDVYSFGVVLVELLTGEKPISSTRSGEGKNLANYFISSIKENRLFEILDVQVVKGGKKDDIEVVANLAKRCLNLNSKKRPTMREVSIELEGLRMSAGHTMIQQNLQQVESFITVPSSIWNGASTSNGFRSLESSVTVPLDDQPLLFNTSSYSC